MPIPAALLALALAAPGPTDPVLRVVATTLLPVVDPGGFGEVSCVVANDSGGDLRVHLEGHLRFEGAGRARVLGPTVLDVPAGVTLEIAPLFLVPEDAEPGPAAFTCRAHVAGPLPEDRRQDASGADRRGEATASFVVR
jgi:hypothetical protein